MEYTIADFLKTPEVDGLRLVAGEQGIENVISRTNIMDNPDTFDWLIAGELVLSTGYIFGNDEGLQRNIIRQLAEIHCAGLCIKTKRYFNEIPACMIDEAQKLRFPVIELPFGYSLSTITNLINVQVYQQGQNVLEQTISIHRQLTQVALNSGGLEQVAKVTVKLIGNPVVILDSKWRLLCLHDHAGNPYPLADHLGTTKKAPCFPPDFTDNMPNTLNKFRKPITRRIVLADGSQILCRVLPIGVHELEVYGYLVVWETVHTLTAIDYIALEQASIIAAIERVRAREIDEIKLRVKKDFFDDLLAGSIESLNAVRSLAELHGLRYDRRYLCILAKYSAGGHAEKLFNQHKFNADAERCAELAARSARKAGVHILCVPRSLQVAILVEIPEQKTAEDIRRDTELFAETLLEEMAAVFPKEETYIAVGSVAADITAITESFQGAQQAAKFVRNGVPVVFIDDYAVYQLLNENVDKSRLTRFFESSIGKLYAYDQENGTQLVETLDNYFAYDGNISEAAKNMYIHRNTYIYRMDKIKSILNTDLKNPQKLLEYQLGIMAMKISGKQVRQSAQ